MNPGQLNKRLVILAFDKGAWETVNGCWAKIGRKERVIFSPYAAAAPGAKLIVRRCNITLYNALRLGEQHYMLTSISEGEHSGYLEVLAAEVKLTQCSCVVPSYKMGVLNRPEPTPSEDSMFPGVFSQKYVKWEQTQPNAELESGIILSTPKAVELHSGDVITAEGKQYAVRACYTLDEYRNDYEIVKGADA
ncbi:MAG TPA: hypothetical protein PKX46_00075 [Clostridia bacterium]|nr:hypothetical protein [Clostridia bacterium]